LASRVLSMRAFHCHWKSPDQPLVIDLAFQVGRCGRRGFENAVADRESRMSAME
jgi:hypothetical protein